MKIKEYEFQGIPFKPAEHYNVYKVMNVEDKEEYAAKVCHRQYVYENYENIQRLLANLDELNLPPLFLIPKKPIRTKNKLYIFSKYANRGSVEDFGLEKVSWQNAKFILRKVIEACQILAEKGYVHEKLAPQHILLNESEGRLECFISGIKHIKKSSNAVRENMESIKSIAYWLFTGEILTSKCQINSLREVLGPEEKEKAFLNLCSSELATFEDLKQHPLLQSKIKVVEKLEEYKMKVTRIPSLAPDIEFEIETLSSTFSNSPFIKKFIECLYCTTDKSYYLMEESAPTLEDFYSANKSFSYDQVREILLCVALAIKQIHARGLSELIISRKTITCNYAAKIIRKIEFAGIGYYRNFPFTEKFKFPSDWKNKEAQPEDIKNLGTLACYLLTGNPEATVEDGYKEAANYEELMELLDGCFEEDPSDRLSIEDVLNKPYFNDLKIEAVSGTSTEYYILQQIKGGDFAEINICLDSSTGEKYIIERFENEESANKVISFHEETKHIKLVEIKQTFKDSEDLVSVVFGPFDCDLLTFFKASNYSLSNELIKKVSTAVALACSSLHGTGKVHYAVCMENVFLKFEGGNEVEVKLGPAGFYEELENEGNYYVPPNFQEGTLEPRQIDIWSYGVLLYLMLERKLPEDSCIGDASREDFGDDLPAGHLKDLVLACLQEDSPPTFEELLKMSYFSEQSSHNDALISLLLLMSKDTEKANIMRTVQVKQIKNQMASYTFISLLLMLSYGLCVEKAFDMSEGLVEYSLKCLKNTYHTLIFAGSNSMGEMNNYVYSNVRAAKHFDEKLNAGVYINPCKLCDPKKQVHDLCVRLEILGEVELSIFVLKQYFTGDKAKNRDYIKKMVEAAQKYIGNRRCFSKVLIYTDKFNWEQVVGVWEELGHSTKLWWRSIDGDATLKNYKPFGGWQKSAVAYKHYANEYKICDIEEPGISSYSWQQCILCYYHTATILIKILSIVQNNQVIQSFHTQFTIIFIKHMRRARKRTDIIESTDPGQAFSRIQSEVAKARTPHLVAGDNQRIKLAQKYVERRREEQRALLGQQLRNKGPMQVQRATAGDQMSLAVGTMYSLGGGVGVVAGLLKAAARGKGLLKPIYIRMHVTSVINEFVRETARFGNNVAGIGLMYFVIAKSTSYIFEEELQYVPKLLHISLCGALTGALCRSVYGRRPALFAAGIGFVAAPLLHVILSKANANINIQLIINPPVFIFQQNCISQIQTSLNSMRFLQCHRCGTCPHVHSTLSLRISPCKQGNLFL
eukprot:TRINITY_DN1813_c0_g1_i1.p1 TRINITY_DN1813_c0_g1~~TRINITY_DN1813_c0_g1_i1.p1  ORF type:complete len:1261 (-),score=117.20 TRINITY_DN1813_c0_g1_i1:5003-8785(-)